MEKRKLGILGSGYLGEIIAKAWKDGYLEEYELVGIYGRNPQTTVALAQKYGCTACASMEELLLRRPDFIAEAASVEAIRDYAGQILRSGSSLIVLSIGAFADADFYGQIRRTAAESGTRVYIASGAVGGFDVLRTLCLMGSAKTNFEAMKAPKSLRNTPLFAEHLMTDTEPSQVFDGNTREAIGLLPTKVNVAVATALASAGPENVSMQIQSIPGFVGDEHRIHAEIDGFRADLDIYSGTAAIAGWSVVAVLRNIVSPVVF